MIITETERLFFIKYQEGDLDIYHQLMSNPKVAKYITGQPPTHKQSKNRFEYILSLNKANDAFGFFKVVEKHTNTPIGLAKLVATDESQAELGYAVQPHYWKKGFGSEITQGLIDFTKSATTLTSLLAIVQPQNEVSVNLLQKFGFQFSHPIPDPKGVEQLVSAYIISI